MKATKETRASDTSTPKPSKILQALKPVLTISRFMGVSPFEFRENDSIIIVNKKSYWYKYSVFIFFLTTLVAIFQIVALTISIFNRHSVVSIIGQSQWFYGGLIAYFMTMFNFVRSDTISKLFNEWSKIENDVKDLFDEKDRTSKQREVLYIIYGVMAAISIVSGTVHVFLTPNYPAYLLYYIRNKDGTPAQFSYFEISLYALFETWMFAWMWTGYILLEVSCSVFAMIFIQCMNSIEKTLETFAALQLVENETQDSSIFSARKRSTPIGFEDYNFPQLTEIEIPSGEIHRNYNNMKIVLSCIDDLQKIASLQSRFNTIVGPLILLDFGQLIFMICSLIFLLLKFLQDFDTHAILLFGGDGICFFGRLVIIIICLGNVYPASLKVLNSMAKVMMRLTLHDTNDSTIMNLILGHISIYTLNPICFTAWDFFPITRGTLLAAFSVITTYLVVLVQTF